MINQLLHRQPVPVDRAQHRQTRLQIPVKDWGVSSRLNSLFVAASEFGDACREFPVVFIRAGTAEDGSQQIAPIAVLGLTQEDNLYLDGPKWRARYLPALLRIYPFCIARLDDERFAICIDGAWNGVSTTEGEPLFNDDGEPAPLMTQVQQDLEVIEAEVQRTRLVGQRLLELDLLRDMRFDATLPGGANHSVDGFLTVDEAKLKALPDATLAEMHRQGLLGLIHAHWISLGNMGRLLEWHIERHAVVPPGAANTAV